MSEVIAEIFLKRLAGIRLHTLKSRCCLQLSIKNQ